MKNVTDSKIKIVYVAGPFRGKDTWEIECNVRAAEELALQVWGAGAACICPHANTRFFQHTLPDEIFLAGDLEIVKRCDAVITVGKWLLSEGTKGEVELANKEGIPVFHSFGALVRWLVKEEKNDG